MATPLEVVNQALLLLGEGLVSSLTEDSVPARTVNHLLPFSRKAVLRDLMPGCARVFVEPDETPDPQPLHPDHLYLYDLPSDLLRVVRVLSGNGAILEGRGAPVIQRWRIMAGDPLGGPPRLACDEAGIAIEYVADRQVETLDALTTEALAAYLAMKMAVPLTESTTKQGAMAELYEALKGQALGANEQEVPPDRFGDISRLTLARHGTS